MNGACALEVAESAEWGKASFSVCPESPCRPEHRCAGHESTARSRTTTASPE